MPKITYQHPSLHTETELSPDLVELIERNETTLGSLFEKKYLARVKIEDRLRTEMKIIMDEIFSFGKDVLPSQAFNLKTVLVLLEFGVFTEQQVSSVFKLYQRDICFRQFMDELEHSLFFELFNPNKPGKYEYATVLKNFRDFMIEIEAEINGDLSLKEAQITFIDRALAILKDNVTAPQFTDKLKGCFTAALKKRLSQLERG